MEAETYTMGAEGFIPLWDVNVFGAPTPPQPLVKDSVVNVVGAAFMLGLRLGFQSQQHTFCSVVDATHF